MVEYFAIGQACSSDDDCPEACFTSMVFYFACPHFQGGQLNFSEEL